MTYPIKLWYLSLCYLNYQICELADINAVEFSAGHRTFNVFRILVIQKRSKYFQVDIFFSFHFQQRKYTFANKIELTVIESN